MANLLSSKPNKIDFAALDAERLSRFEARLRTLRALAARDAGDRPLESIVPDRSSDFELRLEELETEPSLATALDLLDGLERARRALAAESLSGTADPSPGASSGGELVCYWPGRSLATGEANIESRGFYDELDRPPLGLWLDAVARPQGATRGEFETMILVWIPARIRDRARAGWLACASGALAPLAGTSGELALQLQAVVTGSARPGAESP